MTKTLRHRLAAITATLMLALTVAFAGVTTAPPASAHETGSHYCGHGTYTTFGWWDRYDRSYNVWRNGRKYHVHVYQHISRWISPTHTYARTCGSFSGTRLTHWAKGGPA